MPDEKMELSPKADLELTESSLSFISSLSCKDDEVALPDSMNSESCNQICPDDLMKTDVMEANADIFNINSLNIESSDSLLNALTSVEGGGGLSDFDSITESSGTNLGQDVIMTNEVNMVSENNLVQSPSNFITVSSSKTLDFASIKSNLSASNKSGPTQLLIFPKQSNLQNMLVGAKTLPAASASNVAIVQAPPGVSAGTKILTLPSLNTGGNVINTMSSAQPGKLNDVKILLSQGSNSGSFITAKPVMTASGTPISQVFQGSVKRAIAPSSNNQLVTKVIITNSANPGASIVSPIPVSAAPSSTAAPSGQHQPILLASPSKTLTLSRNLVNLGGSQQILRTVPGTPTKQFVISPVKPAQKVAYAPLTYSKSPRRIAPATSVSVSNIPKIATVLCHNPTSIAPATVNTKITIPQSPTKVILKSVPQTLLKPLVSVNNSSTAPTTAVSSSAAVLQTVQATQAATSGTTHSLQVPGNKFHYVRLVSANNPGGQTLKIIKEPPTTPQISTVVSLNTATTSTSLSQVRPTVPIAPAKLITPKVGPKFLIPAVSSSQIRSGTSSVSSSHIGQLPAGTLIPVGAGSSSYVMVPAQYVTQLQQPGTTSSTGSTVLNILPAPAVSSSSLTPQSTIISITSNPPNNFHSSAAMHGSPPHSSRRTTPVETDTRPRKPCNCTKSMCLKLYCDCFANGEFCNSCNCTNCYNNLNHEEERQKAIKACLDRNPYAFHPKIGKSRGGGGGSSDQERRHTKGCNCKRSYCLKNYCECYEAKILCTNLCKCVGCKNFEDSSERKTLMHLADAAEVRVQQQAAAKTNLSSQILDIPTKPPVMSQTGERLPFAFVTDDVLEATCLCLLAQASEAEKSHTSEEEMERLVLQEFGRCLVRIIDCANKTKVSKMDIQ